MPSPLDGARADLTLFAFTIGFLFALLVRMNRRVHEIDQAVDELAGVAVGAVAAAAAAVDEAQARTPERIFIPEPAKRPDELVERRDASHPVDGGLLCKRCDVYVGFGAAGVAKRPDESPEWLADHCWVCRRHADAIRAEQEPERA